MDSYPVLLTAQEAADILRVSRWRVYDLISQNVIPVIRFGRQVRIPRDKLWDLIQAPSPANPVRSRDGG
ncbi:hypothetical protein TPY_3151 [Sulfobacillus acidophilus TPY]|uniref:DNA binding domain protein, excisionase family n=1 Tax=Sulfobacillus acidophilus (strain ATCC 700253 / DSM 10332 / NAL) TaxID=679936 RepID=G8U153_SULAD|nr:hypothetical protein TPY_3151 [Sulfobacillus acidophilus TPY]AEW04286.1 DNA binding domain protein, excisionase family [Sulfobacillus acidophilus DSM 10332]